MSGHMFARLDDSLDPQVTDRMGWYIEAEGGAMIPMLSKDGFTACGAITINSMHYRAVCFRWQVGDTQPTVYTGDWIAPEIGSAPILTYETKPVKVTEPGTIVYAPEIRSTGTYCIKVDAPGVTIFGGNLEGENNGILLTDKANGVLIHSAKVHKTTKGYGLCNIKGGKQEFTCLTRSYIGPSAHECSIRSTTPMRNFVMVKSTAQDDGSKQAVRMASRGSKYWDMHRSRMLNGGIIIGNVGGGQWAAQLRITRCLLSGANHGGGGEDGRGGDSMIGIKPNARSVLVVGNKIISEIERLRVITMPSRADRVDRDEYPDAWSGGGGVTVAYNTIETPRSDSGMRTGTPEGWDGSPIIFENNVTNGMPITANTNRTPGAWVDYNGKEIPLTNTNPGYLQPTKINDPGTWVTLDARELD